MKKMFILLSLTVLLIPVTSASSWTVTGYSSTNYLNANVSTKIDWSNLSCTDGQSQYVTITVNWGDGSQTVSQGVNSPGYIITPAPVHSYSAYAPSEYTGTIYCLENPGTGHITYTFTVMVYLGYSGGGLGGGSRPRQM